MTNDCWSSSSCKISLEPWLLCLSCSTPAEEYRGRAIGSQDSTRSGLASVCSHDTDLFCHCRFPLFVGAITIHQRYRQTDGQQARSISATCNWGVFYPPPFPMHFYRNAVKPLKVVTKAYMTFPG